MVDENSDRQREAATFRHPPDPLGYDTRDPDCVRKMARDALTGRNESAVDVEVAAARKRLGLTPKRPSRWCRLRRWLSHRRWRFHFWRKDRGWW